MMFFKSIKKEIKKVKQRLDELEKQMFSINSGNNCVIYTDNTLQSDCLHDKCLRCNGTGIDKNSGSMCVHNISCPCPKCTWR